MKPTDLRGILRYIPRYREKTFVVAVDGIVVTDDNFANLLLDLAVPPGAFSPPPKVDSEVVVFTPRKAPRIAMTHEQEPLWEKLLKTSFAHRRKMLRAGLPKSGPWLKALEKSLEADDADAALADKINLLIDGAGAILAMIDRSDKRKALLAQLASLDAAA